MSGHPSHRTGAPIAGEDLFVYGRDTVAARRHFSLEQKGKCATCGRKVGRLELDHEHSDLQLCRGLLCLNCNRALGLIADSRETLQAMLDYLDKHDGRNAAYVETDDFEERTVKVYRYTLSPGQVKARNERMRDAFDQGSTIEQLMERFGLARSSVYEAIYGGESQEATTG